MRASDLDTHLASRVFGVVVLHAAVRPAPMDRRLRRARVPTWVEAVMAVRTIFGMCMALSYGRCVLLRVVPEMSATEACR